MIASRIDLDDVSQCPLGDACVSCDTGDHLCVSTLDTQVGVVCLTLCRVCVEAGVLDFRLPIQTAAELVMDHCGHLGIDVDEMAVVRAERKEER